MVYSKIRTAKLRGARAIVNQGAPETVC